MNVARRVLGSTATRIALAATLAAGMFLGATAARASSFKDGQRLVGVTVGLGGLAGAYGDASGSVLGVEYDQAINPEWSVGGILGHTSSHYHANYLGTAWGWDYGYTIIGARGAYHFAKQIKDPRLDAYVGATLGYDVVSASYNGPTGIPYGSASSSYMLFGIHGGGRYDMSNKWGLQGELGFGIGYLSLGAYMRL